MRHNNGLFGGFFGGIFGTSAAVCEVVLAALRAALRAKNRRRIDGVDMRVVEACRASAKHGRQVDHVEACVDATDDLRCATDESRARLATDARRACSSQRKAIAHDACWTPYNRSALSVGHLPTKSHGAILMRLRT